VMNPESARARDEGRMTKDGRRKKPSSVDRVE